MLAASPVGGDVSTGAARRRDAAPTIGSEAKDRALMQRRRAILTPQSHGVLFRACSRERP